MCHCVHLGHSHTFLDIHIVCTARASIGPNFESQIFSRISVYSPNPRISRKCQISPKFWIIPSRDSFNSNNPAIPSSEFPVISISPKTSPKLNVTYCYDAFTFQSSNSFAIFEAIFLKLMELPEMRLNRTPFSDNRGSLHTSISHCTLLSSAELPWKQIRRNFSLCS